MKIYLKIALIVLSGALLISSAWISISKEARSAFVEMEVKGVSLDASGENPVVILSDKKEKRAFPIWIGLLEANAIDKELRNILSPRPMTHDLLHSILGRVQARVKEVKITDLKDHTYYASLCLTLNKETIEIDARPSDAIIVALKSKAPIFVSTRILDEQGIDLDKRETSGERLGIRVQKLTSSLASHFSFKGQSGVLVSQVTPGSSFEASGIKAGDIITKVNSKQIGSIQEFEETLDAAKDAHSVRISLFREGKSKEVTLSLKP